MGWPLEQFDLYSNDLNYMVGWCVQVLFNRDGNSYAIPVWYHRSSWVHRQWRAPSAMPIDESFHPSAIWCRHRFSMQHPRDCPYAGVKIEMGETNRNIFFVQRFWISIVLNVLFYLGFEFFELFLPILTVFLNFLGSLIFGLLESACLTFKKKACNKKLATIDDILSIQAILLIFIRKIRGKTFRAK